MATQAAPVIESTIKPRSRVTPGEDLITTFLAACMVAGVLTDAWAHTNRFETIESFFTPWHGLLYTGFAAIAAWTVWLAYRNRATTPRWWRHGWPVGYALGAVGAAGFLVGGFLDMVWHSVFGVELSLDIAFSPSHLLLSFSAALLLTSPVRSWWASGEDGRRAVAGVLSLAFGTVFSGVLLTTFSAFTSMAPTRSYDHIQGSPSHMSAQLGMVDYLVTTVLLVLPFLLAYRRRPVPGIATAIVAVVGMFASIMYDLPGTRTWAAVGAIVGAVLADLALVRLDAVRGRDAVLRLPIAGALFPALVWTGHLVGMHLAGGVRWPAALVAGSVAFSGVIGLILGSLASPPRPVWHPTGADTAAGRH